MLFGIDRVILGLFLLWKLKVFKGLKVLVEKLFGVFLFCFFRVIVNFRVVKVKVIFLVICYVLIFVKDEFF